MRKIEKKILKISKNIRSVFNLKAASSKKIEVFLSDSEDHKTSYIHILPKNKKIYKFEKNQNFKNFHFGILEGSHKLCYMIYTFFSNLYIQIISISTGKIVQKTVKSLEFIKTKKIQKVDNKGSKLYIFYLGGSIVYNTLKRTEKQVEMPLTVLYSVVKTQKMKISKSEKKAKGIYIVDIKDTIGENITPIHL